MPTYGSAGLIDLAQSGMRGESQLPSRMPTANFGAGAAFGGTPRAQTTGSMPYSSAIAGGIQRDAQQPVQQMAADDMQNPGYGEQAFLYSQNRLLNDPAQEYLMNAANAQLNPSAGENYMNQNLGTLDGPGYGEQYWNQVQGQYMQPFAGEQFAREQAQAMGAQGAAGAFNTQLQGQYDDFVNYQGAGNAQGQYNTSAASLAGGTRGEQGLGQIAGGYAQNGSYTGANNALGQYQANAASGPMASQQFYDSVAGQFGQIGQYSGPNLSAGQYAQTQQAFGDLPIANFDPFYDRARQIGTQDYNRQAAGRGVYGSSEALSGVSNFIADIEAQRANRSFDAEMQRAVEQRNRQQLLGQQAQMGDQSSLAAFGANLSGLQTFGSLANQAGNQTLAQQTMLGNQARQADLSGTDAFRANLEGAQTYANINSQLANTELDRNRLLGDMANNADSQANAAQNTRISGANALGSAAQAADSAEVSRFNARTGAMNEADRNQLARMNSGADVAFRGDDSRRSDYESSMNQARQAATLGMDRTRLGADLANTASQNDLNRLNSFNSQAQGAEAQRQAREIAQLDAVSNMSNDLKNLLGQGLNNVIGGSQGDFENWFNADMAQALQQAGYSQQQINAMRQDIGTAMGFVGQMTSSVGGQQKKTPRPAKADPTNPYG